MKNKESIELWEARIQEIEKTGNCMCKGRNPSPYFGGVRKKYTKAEMIDFCRRMIERLESK